MSNPAEDTSKSSTENMASAANSTTQKEERVEEVRKHVVPDSQKPPGTPSSLEKDGLRTHDDGLDGGYEPPMSFRRFMCFVGMSFLWTSATIPAYLYGGIPQIIYHEIGGERTWIWFITGYLLATAAICPFVGALSDLLGRRHVAMIGCALLLVGQAVCASAQSMEAFIAGMSVTGVGAGINELTALAGTAELAPTARRGIYVAVLMFTILPFLPSVLWAQLIAQVNWRFVGLLTGLWTALGLTVVVFFYFPPPRVNSRGLTRSEIVSRIDFVGGFLSIAAVVLFDFGILSGGYQYPWTDARTLAPLILGVVLTAAFVAWEVRGAAHPMVPRRLGRVPRTLALLLVITFVSGANFFAVILIWPGQAYNVYGHDPVGVGMRGMPFAFGVLGGCVASLWLLTALRGGARRLLLAASVVMTAGCGAMAAARPDNAGAVYAVLFVAGLGVGGIVVPASLITTIICPDDLIATITALTLAVRVVGGAIGYAVYYNVFGSKVVPLVGRHIAVTLRSAGITDEKLVKAVTQLTLGSNTGVIVRLPEVVAHPGLGSALVAAGQEAYALAYPWVYYCSIAFGGLSIAATLFLEDIGEFMDDHVAVVIA